MKKILMFLCCVFAINGAWGAGDCPASFIQFSGIQKPNDNEFLYTTAAAQQSAVAGFENSRSFKLTGGQVYECDNQQGCMNGSLVFVDSDKEFVFKGNTVSSVIFQCAVGFEDKWNTYKYNECPDNLYDNKPIKFINDDTDKCRAVGPYNYCCYTGEHLKCLQAAKNDEPAAWTVEGKCYCGNRKDGNTEQYTWNGEHCVPVKINESGKKSCDGVAHGKSETKNCPSNIPNANQCKRTCNDGKWSGWTLVSCKTGYKVQSGKCVAISNDNGGGNNGGQQPGGNNGGDDVTPPAQNPGTYICDPSKLPNLNAWRGEWSNDSEIVSKIDALLEYCAGKPDEVTFIRWYSDIEALIAKRRSEKQMAAELELKTAAINNAEKELNSIMGGLKTSAWKTAEGNFNGARLASDSIAGVVLGTAGGLITSHLVKKGQVKNGFEDIQCTVGGQKVADWGDEFTVGIR